MATAGYSGTSLIIKLGIKPGMKIRLINPPANYFTLLKTDISNQVIDQGIPDFVHLFVTSFKQFVSIMKKIYRVYNKNRQLIIWVSWYKKSSGIVTDVNEDLIRDYALQNELVDIKVCAVSETWSGLKLVVRKELRGKKV